MPDKINICLQKENTCKGFHPKKKSCTSNGFKKNSCKLKIPPPPPPPFTFLMVRPLLGSTFTTGYVPLAFQSPHPIIVYSVANYRPHLTDVCENVNFAIPTKSLYIFYTPNPY